MLRAHELAISVLPARYGSQERVRKLFDRLCRAEDEIRVIACASASDPDVLSDGFAYLRRS